MNGTFYGSTSNGGGSNLGVVYSLTTSGAITVLHDFTGGSDGGNPQAGLVDVHGTLYGTTYIGGTPGRRGKGIVYSIGTTGGEKVLHAFSPRSDQSHPRGDLIAVNGTLYGATLEGGGGTCLTHGRDYGCGTIYSITTTGKEKIVGTFSSDFYGAFPEAGLTSGQWSALRHDRSRRIGV